MPDTGWLNGTSVDTTRVMGGNQNNLFSVTNILLQDGLTTSGNIISGNFTIPLEIDGFDLSSVPSGSTLDGIEFRNYRDASANNRMRDNNFLLYDGASAASNNLADFTYWTTTPTEVLYGGASDTIGCTMTMDQIKANPPTLLWRGIAVGGSVAPYIDNIQIKYYYTPPAPTSKYINIGIIG